MTWNYHKYLEKWPVEENDDAEIERLAIKGSTTESTISSNCCGCSSKTEVLDKISRRRDNSTIVDCVGDKSWEGESFFDPTVDLEIDKG